MTLNEKIENLCLRSAGIYKEGFRRKFEAEYAYYVSLGALNILVAVLAGISCGYFIFGIFNSFVGSLLFGCFWFIVMFHLNRFLLKGVDKYEGRKNGFIFMTRLLLAVLTALLMSMPLELLISEEGIKDALYQKDFQRDSSAMLAPFTKEIYSRIDTLTFEKSKFITNNPTPIREEYVRFDAKTESSRDGDEKRYLAAREAYAKELNSFDLKIDTLRRSVLLREEIIRNEITAKIDKHSIYEKIDMLDNLTPAFSTQWYFMWVLRLIIILLDVIPLLLKIQPAFRVFEYSIKSWEKIKVLKLDRKVLNEELKSKRKINVPSSFPKNGVEVH